MTIISGASSADLDADLAKLDDEALLLALDAASDDDRAVLMAEMERRGLDV